MIYDVIDNVLPEQFNRFVVNELRHTPRWASAMPETEDAKNHGDGGMLMLTFPNRYDDPIVERMNTFGHIICDSVFNAHKSKGNFQDIEIDRFLYNFYTRSSKCFIHQDVSKTGQQPGQFLASFIYCLNDNDGYNIVNDQKIETKAGRCIIFSSYDYHSAVGPTEYPHRYTLNCTFKYTSYDAEWVKQVRK